jgi:outer membrane protein assembly factor BamB
MNLQISVLICFVSWFLLISCRNQDVQTQYDSDGVATQIPHVWQSSISDGAFGQKLYNGYTIADKGVLCELKRESDADNSSWKSSLALKDVETGENLWVWDDFYDKKIVWTLNDDFAVINDRLWVHDLMSDYYIDANSGKTIWRHKRTFPSYSEAANIEEKLFFIANGQAARSEGKIADSFFKYDQSGQSFTEISHPPYSEEFAFHNGLGLAVGSLQDIYAFRDENTDYSLVPYLERGPMTGSEQNQPMNRTFLGLFNLTLNKWVYDRKPVSFEGEFGMLSLKPIVNGQDVYLTSGNFALCFDLFSGEKKWHRRLTSERTVPVDMLYADGKLLVNMANATLYCLSANDGSNVWSQKSNSLSSDLYHQNGVIYWIPLGNLRAVDLQTGKLIWNLNTIERSTSNGRRSEWHGFVTGVEGKDGRKGKIFATTDHYLYCFDAAR